MAKYVKLYDVMDALLYEQYGYLCEDAIKAIPAIEIPPHGRLIDADALIRDNGIKEIPEYHEVVLAAPTIIEAEEGE